MDLLYEPEEEAFREEVRAFIDAEGIHAKTWSKRPPLRNSFWWSVHSRLRTRLCRSMGEWDTPRTMLWSSSSGM